MHGNSYGCHGCGGKGWVIAGTGSPTECIICKGTGVAQSKYRSPDAGPKTTLPPNPNFALCGVRANPDGTTSIEEIDGRLPDRVIFPSLGTVETW